MIAVAVLLVFFIYYPLDYKLISAALILFLSYNVWGVFSISANVFVKSLNRADTEEKEIALTFDDGPHPEKTSQILEILGKYNIKAAFFLIGEKAEKNYNIIRHIDEEDHLLGNHSYSHKVALTFASSGKVHGDIIKCSKIITKATGRRALFFRPPFGVTNPSIAKAIKKTGYYSAGWSCRSLDTKISEPEKLFLRLKKNLKPGAVYLFHDYSDSNVYTLDRFIQYAISQGYRFERLDNLFKVSGYDKFN